MQGIGLLNGRIMKEQSIYVLMTIFTHEGNLYRLSPSWCNIPLGRQER